MLHQVPVSAPEVHGMFISGTIYDKRGEVYSHASSMQVHH